MAFPQTVRWINEILNNLSQVRLFLVPSGGVILWHGASNAVPKGWAICDGTNGTPDLRDRFVIGAGGKYGLDATGGAASATPDVTAGTAKTGISLQQATASVSVGTSQTGISIQNATLNVWTGAAGTGIGIQATTLDWNTMPNHTHQTPSDRSEGSDTSLNDSGSGQPPDGYATSTASGNSWGHSHGVSDPGHAHTVGSDPHGHGIADPGHTHTVTTAAHGHGITDGGHSHTITTKAIDVMPPYVALFYIKKL